MDLSPGDRRSGCRGQMEPIAICVRPDGEWAIVHRCRRCKALRINRIAGDDGELPLMSLAVRLLAQPPFPLDSLGREDWEGQKSAGTNNDREASNRQDHAG